MKEPGIYGFARAFTRIEQEALNAVRRRHYDHPQPEGAHVNNLIAAIENDARNIGGDVITAYRTALEHRLSPAQMAAHLADELAAIEADPAIAAVRKAGLGPAATDVLAGIIDGAAASLGHYDQAALNVPPQPGAPLEPLPAPAADSTPAPEPAV